MNKERLLTLAKHLARLPAFVNAKTGTINHVDETICMSSYIREAGPEYGECKTSACIAGWTLLLFGTKGQKQAAVCGDIDYFGEAMTLLELEFPEADLLFTGATSIDIPGKLAAKVIRRFVKTGNVDWYLGTVDKPLNQIIKENTK